MNKCIFTGRLGQDPEIKYTQSGSAVANFSIATSETWKDKDTGEKQEITEWTQVVAFGRLAEVCGEFLSKGSLILAETKKFTQKWTDDSGNDRYSTKFKLVTMEMLGGRPNAGGNAGGNATKSNTKEQQDRPGYEDDDIPF